MRTATQYEWHDLVDEPLDYWIRNKSDERAVDEGCIFDFESAIYPLDWWAEYLCLYEGEWAGDPFIAVRWQIPNTMRTYGWLRWSTKANRFIRRHTRATTIISKKNAKSPTLGAHALFLGCGDGEQGQSVYLMARDGAQARRTSGKHMLKMCQHSPLLMQECKINRTRGGIYAII